MFASSAIALLLIGAVAADHEGNVVTLGSAMDFSVPTGSSTCPIKLSVPASVVGADCRLRIRYDIPEGDPRTPTISFFLKKGGVGTFTDADKVVVTDRQYEGPCEAGEFYFGAKVESCTACVLGANAPFYISHTIIKNGTAVIDMGTKTEFYTSRIFAKADQYIVHTFETTAAMQTAHWKILKCSLCAFDTYKYYQAPASASIADATVAGNEVTSTSSASLDRRVEYQIPAAGKYQFIIKLGSAGTNTYVISQFKLGGEPDSVKLAEAKCPKKDCAADDLKSCKPCNDNGCNWCAGSQKQCVPGVCAVEADLKDDSSDCPDVDMECRSIKTNCKDCVTKGGCIWCDTGATFGFSSGVCTAGVDGLAKTCNTVGSAIKVTQMSTTLTECPGGNAASLVMSAVALLVAAVAMI